MTIFDASNADEGFFFTGTTMPADAIDFASQVTANATTYSWLTSTGHLVTATGNFTYPGGNVAGTVTSLAIDLSNDADSDIAITGAANIDIALLLAGNDSFWEALFSGADTFIAAPSVDQRFSGDANDDSAISGGADSFTFNFVNGGGDFYGDQWDTLGGIAVPGGNDTFTVNGSIAVAGTGFNGDTSTVNPGEAYAGGDDTFTVNITGLNIEINCDATSVYDQFTGGSDTVTILGGGVSVFGDADAVDSAAAFIGGNDTIVNGLLVYGDCGNYYGGIFTGGSDVLSGTSSVHGDMLAIAGALSAGDSVQCGDDNINASDDSALLYGDMATIAGDVSLASVIFGNDTITGGILGDTIYGDYQSDTSGTLDPAAGGNDVIFAGGGADQIHGNGGDDIIDPGTGDDTVVDGGEGRDTISYASLAVGVTVNLGSQGVGQNTIGGGIDTLTNFENILGGSGNDTLTGDDGADNVITGGLGDDVLTGGTNLAEGDTASYAGNVAVTVSLALQGGQQDTLGAGLDTLNGFENLSGSDQGDTLTGNGSANTLSGGGGGDILSGAGGADTIHGGEGADDIKIGRAHV